MTEYQQGLPLKNESAKPTFSYVGNPFDISDLPAAP